VFEVATGKLPYVAETPQGVLEQHLFAKIPSMRSVRPDVPIELDDLTQAMMAKSPLDRPTSMGYVSGKLRGLMAVCRKMS
jgi:serine/threonine-protein kinase